MAITALVPGTRPGKSYGLIGPKDLAVLVLAEVCATGQYVNSLTATGQYVSSLTATGQHVNTLTATGSIPEC